MATDFKVEAKLSELFGHSTDEISLLNDMTGKFFQGIPQYSTVYQFD